MVWVGVALLVLAHLISMLRTYKQGRDDGYEEAVKDFASATGIKMETQITYTKWARTRRFLGIG